jgi:hypothetical protein
MLEQLPKKDFSTFEVDPTADPVEEFLSRFSGENGKDHVSHVKC